MKKNLLAAFLCCTIITTSAQDVDPDRNRTYNIVLNNVQYTHRDEKMSAGEAVGAVLTGVLTGQTSVEATKYESDVKGAIIKGLSGAHRFHYNDGLVQVSDVAEEGNIAVNALITNGLLGKDFKLTAIQPEYRYWFSGRPINKWFVGAGAIGAIFDVKHKGKVYDGYGFGAGITYGYVWNVTERLSIDFHSGFGAFFYTRKEYFEQDNYDVDYTENGVQRANATGYYLLPTRIGVSVSYILK